MDINTLARTVNQPRQFYAEIRELYQEGRISPETLKPLVVLIDYKIQMVAFSGFMNRRVVPMRPDEINSYTRQQV